MDLQDLRTLAAVIDAGTVAAAAERLHRVPSAVTMRIKDLETELGAPLFERRGRQLYPTPEAMALASDGRRILTLAEAAKARFMSDEPVGPLKLGALDSVAGTRLPPPLCRLLKAHPGIELTLRTGVSADLLTELRSGALDAAILVDAPRDDKFARIKIWDETLALISQAGRAPIHSPEEVEGETVLAFQTGCSYRDRILGWFARFGCRPGRIIEVSSYSAIIGSVAAGMGLAVAPRHLLETFHASAAVTLHPLPGEFAFAEVELVRRAGPETPVLKALREALLGLDGSAETIKKTE
ncbi:LysR family transcriptional regulator [Sutterella sp.]|uniref:LysR family transcriptional regulator n=1 Tax=Sutterella sp. TaxID=1981025 RepID=UPI0026E02BE1|nr:LysR family transcriptional regulator [Sutterella sp.]MDO5532946.1 LysR family transcriptional regulator [Sutterella sp.]